MTFALSFRIHRSWQRDPRVGRSRRSDDSSNPNVNIPRYFTFLSLQKLIARRSVERNNYNASREKGLLRFSDPIRKQTYHRRFAIKIEHGLVRGDGRKRWSIHRPLWWPVISQSGRTRKRNVCGSLGRLDWPLAPRSAEEVRDFPDFFVICTPLNTWIRKN